MSSVKPISETIDLDKTVQRSPEQFMFQLLRGMEQYDSSDLHLKVGFAPYYRVNGRLRRIGTGLLSSSEFLEAMLEPLVPRARRHEYEERGDLDFSYHDKDGSRYRVNVFRASGEMHSAIRRVKSQIPSFLDLQLPPIYAELIDRTHDGLILVSGVTGCGKSSTLAAMLEHINQTRQRHIITIEDPIEFVFKPAKSIVSQREIGLDIATYAEALRFVVRQDPDVIFIGEMRDRETVLAALQAAETGHLVLGSLHTTDTMQAFSRILEFFPQEMHEFIRSTLANSLTAIMCQRLLPTIDKKIGRAPATEVLLNNAPVREKIRHGEEEDLPTIVASSIGEGMRNFTYSLADMIESELIYYDTAMEYAPNRDALQAAVKGIKMSQQSIVRLRSR
ncbi:MAG: PilT/PilU family type 4a pilus ATPase [Planctomycetota bacterium]|nr:PilT/PilU family type 4a pilus ATPase [Planctomycetota bacterium]